MVADCCVDGAASAVKEANRSDIAMNGRELEVGEAGNLYGRHVPGAVP